MPRRFAAPRVLARIPASVAVTVLLVRLVDEWASFLPAATFDAFRADLGLTYRAAAIALVAIGPGAVAGSIVMVLADTRSRRVLATLGAAVYAGALALFAGATAPLMVVAGGFAVGLGSTLLVDTVEVALVDLCEEDGDHVAHNLLERALAHMNLAAGVGDLSGPLLVAGAAALGWSWRVSLWITAAAVAAYAVLVAVTPFPPPQPVEPRDEAPRRPFRDALAVAGRRDVWWAGACGAILVALDEAFVAYVIAYLREERGTSAAFATTVAAVFVVGGLVAAAWLARAHRPDRGRVTVATLRRPALVMLAATALLAAVPNPAVLATSGFAVGAATIAFWVPFQATTLRLVPGRTGAVRAVVGTIEMSGLAVTPVIGAISDAWSLRAGLVAYACLPALLVVLVWRDPLHSPRALSEDLTAGRGTPARGG